MDASDGVIVWTWSGMAWQAEIPGAYPLDQNSAGMR
jgi:hypothetical protein